MSLPQPAACGHAPVSPDTAPPGPDGLTRRYRLCLGTIHDSGPGAYAHVHYDGDLARTRVHVAVDEAGRDMEEVSRRELDGFLSVSAVVEPEPSGDEEPVQVPRPMMMPPRHRSDSNLRARHDHALVLERSVPTDS